MLRKYLFLFFLVNIFSTVAQVNSKLLDSISQGNPVLKRVVMAKAKYRPQIIYTQINRDELNNPTFINHTYLLDSTNYFYCCIQQRWNR